MNNVQLKNKVLREIKQSKLKAESQADLNLQKAMQNNEFKDLYLKIKTLNFDIAKKEFSNNNASEEKKLLKETQKQYTELLKQMGLTSNSFEPNYSCKKCKDTGLVEDKFCECFYNKLNKDVIHNLGMNVDNSHTFEKADFSIFDKPEQVEKMYSKISTWCDSFYQTKYKNIMLSGAPGVGKTYLVESICNKLINKNVFVNYYTAFALCDLFLKYRTSFNENKAGILDGVLNCDVLIIDDFGSEPNIKNTEEYFYLVFNERLAKNKSTIITTNLSLEQILARYGERTFSRLCNKANSILIKFDNSDLRLKRK